MLSWRGILDKQPTCFSATKLLLPSSQRPPQCWHKQLFSCVMNPESKLVQKKGRSMACFNRVVSQSSPLHLQPSVWPYVFWHKGENKIYWLRGSTVGCLLWQQQQHGFILYESGDVPKARQSASALHINPVQLQAPVPGTPWFFWSPCHDTSA